MRLLLERGWALAGYSYRSIEMMLAANFDLQSGTWSNRPDRPAHTEPTPGGAR